MHLETHYVISCASELGELTPLETQTAFRVASISRKIDNQVEKGTFPADFLAKTAREGFESLTETQKHYLTLSSLSSLKHCYQDFLSRASFVCKFKLMTDLELLSEVQFKLLFQDGYEPKRKIFNSVKEVSPKTIELVLQDELQSLCGRWAEDLEQVKRTLRWLKQSPVSRSRLSRELGNLSESSEIGETGFEQIEGWAHAVSTTKKDTRKAKSAIKKVVKLFERANKLDTVKALVAGDEVEISHPDSKLKFVIVANSSNWLIRGSSNPAVTAPLGIYVLTKGNIYLGKLCVYFNDTPVLDQLFALMLYIKSGEESQILASANWFSVDDYETTQTQLYKAGYPEIAKKVARFTPNAARTLSHGCESIQAETVWAPLEGPIREWLKTMLIPIGLQSLIASSPNTLQALPL